MILINNCKKDAVSGADFISNDDNLIKIGSEMENPIELVK